MAHTRMLIFTLYMIPAPIMTYIDVFACFCVLQPFMSPRYPGPRGPVRMPNPVDFNVSNNPLTPTQPHILIKKYIIVPLRLTLTVRG